MFRTSDETDPVLEALAYTLMDPDAEEATKLWLLDQYFGRLCVPDTYLPELTVAYMYGTPKVQEAARQVLTQVNGGIPSLVMDSRDPEKTPEIRATATAVLLRFTEAARKPHKPKKPLPTEGNSPEAKGYEGA